MSKDAEPPPDGSERPGTFREAASHAGEPTRRKYRLSLPAGAALELGRETVVMGVLNVTPDSFSDGGRFLDVPRAVDHGLAMVSEGAAIIDVGGESTRPGAAPVSAAEESARVVPVVEALARATSAPISVDTRHGEVAREALAAGAAILNDVSGLADPKSAEAAANARAAVVLMHMRGTPADMQSRTDYGDLVPEVIGELAGCVERARSAGIAGDRIVVDPGIGFAKTWTQSFELIARLDEFRELDLPILVGPSRKSFLRHVADVPVDRRLHLTLGAVAACVLRGAHIVRVHDVEPTVHAIRAFEAATWGS